MTPEVNGPQEGNTHGLLAEDIVFVGELVGRCPILLSVLQQHLDDWETLLSHLFLGDVARWATLRFQTTRDDHQLAHVLAVLEETYARGQPDVTSLIGLGFIHIIPIPGEPGAGLRALLGPSMTRDVNDYAQ